MPEGEAENNVTKRKGPPSEEVLAHRRAIATCLCFVAIVLIAIWESFGWHLRYIDVLSVQLPVSDEESDAGEWHTRSMYYDLQEKVLFSITDGKEPLFSMEFGDGTAWIPLHTVRTTNYIERYWYEHADVLRKALDGLDFELELDPVNRLFLSLTVHLRQTDEDEAVDAYHEIRSRLTELAINIGEHFSKYRNGSSSVEVVFVYDSLERHDDKVRLYHGW